MDYIQTVQTYSQISRMSVNERLEDCGILRKFSIQIGDDVVDVLDTIYTKRKDLKIKACQLFVRDHCDKIKDAIVEHRRRKTAGVDYIAYSDGVILKDASIRINDCSFFRNQSNYELVAFDSEGQPPNIVQFATDEKTVFIFYISEFYLQIMEILQSDKIVKIVCDRGAEERQFGVIHSAVDIQDASRKSLVTCIKEMFGVDLLKNKRIHFQGWKPPLTEQQIKYAASDVLWMMKIYNAMCDKI